MTSVRQLSKQDILFVAGETTDVYHHTAGLVILDTSDCPGFSFDYFIEKAIERIRDVPHFRWKLHEVPLGLDMPYWVEDEDFRYENHFKRIALPSPGDRQALSEVVAYLYSRHLDRSKPLWEMWCIEGLAGGKFAILQKLHHCMMDGQGASKLGELLCDFEPNAAPRPVEPAIRDARAGELPGRLSLSTTTARHLARFPGAMSRQVFDMVTLRLLKRLGIRGGSRKPGAQAPVTRFNGDISSERGFVFGSLSLTDIKSVRKDFAVSVNDVLLALVSSALRNYLIVRQELPRLALRTGIPVSLRKDDDDEFSNRVTQVSVTLATDLADPVARLKAISAECEEAKQLVRGGGKGFMEILQTMPPWMVTAMMGLTRPEQATQILGSNLIVSNVHGSDKPMYVAGARLDTMYPMSIITPGIGINFTCVSYVDKVDIGATIEPNLVPEPWSIIDGMQSALDEYLELGKQAARQKKRTSGKTAGSRGKTRRKTAQGAARKDTRAAAKATGRGAPAKKRKARVTKKSNPRGKASTG